MLMATAGEYLRSVIRRPVFSAYPLVSLTIVDNDTSPAAGNRWMTQDALFFVRQHYSELSESRARSGWSGLLGGSNHGFAELIRVCVARRRLDVSNAFFYELEFQADGRLRVSTLSRAFGNDQPFSIRMWETLPRPRKIPGYSVFVRDRARLAAGTIKLNNRGIWQLYSSNGPSFCRDIRAR